MNQYSDFYNLLGDNFNIEAVCPDYLPESQCVFTWRRDERGVAIVSGYEPDEDLRNHWLCPCGNFETSGGRCSECGLEPPWGADDYGDDETEDDLDLDFGFFRDIDFMDFAVDDDDDDWEDETRFDYTFMDEEI